MRPTEPPEEGDICKESGAGWEEKRDQQEYKGTSVGDLGKKTCFSEFSTSGLPTVGDDTALTLLPCLLTNITSTALSETSIKIDSDVRFFIISPRREELKR